MNLYRVRVTDTFENDLATLEKVGGEQVLEVVDKVVGKLLKDPLHAANSHRLHGEYAGKRWADIPQVGRGKRRIVFTICAECRSAGDLKHNRPDCPDCEHVPDDTVTLIAIVVH
jgi:mRNA-degrading endonuclease YafQ of YafQ-DinJ toxin-antitoxin module